MLGHDIQFVASKQIPNTFECACPMQTVRTCMRANVHAGRQLEDVHCACGQYRNGYWNGSLTIICVIYLMYFY